MHTGYILHGSVLKQLFSSLVRSRDRQGRDLQGSLTYNGQQNGPDGGTLEVVGLYGNQIAAPFTSRCDEQTGGRGPQAGPSDRACRVWGGLNLGDTCRQYIYI